MFKISIPYLYDIIYRYKNYEGQAQTIRNTLQSLSASEANILEMACGTGRYLEYFDNSTRFGIDLCDESLMYASLRNPTAQFKTYNIMDINKDDCPFDTNQFDAVLALFGAIGYISPQNLFSCLKNWFSLLKPNGVLVLEPWHFEPEEGEYKQFYSSSQLLVRRKASVTVSQGWTNMDFTFQVEHSNNQKEELHSTERLYSHSAEELRTILHALDARVIHTNPSDFQENGQWYIQRAEAHE